MAQIELNVDAGSLCHQVTIYRRTTTKNAATGADEDTFTEVFAETRAEMNPDGGEIFFGADSFNAEENDTCMIRYRPGIDTSMQLVHEGDAFEILAVRDVLRRHVKLMLLLRRLS